MKPACDLKQAHQQLSKRYVTQRLFKNRFGNRSYRTLELVNTGIRWQPSAGDMQFGNTLIIAFEECDHVFCDIALIIVVERTNNAEINDDIGRIFRVFLRDKNISRVQIGMKKAVAKDLREKNFNSALS